MRLLNIETLELEWFPGSDYVPRYTILSHTWGPDEVTLQHLSHPRSTIEDLRGWRKIVAFRDAILRHAHLLPKPVEYIWVDTCCIDKTSSAELSEAINSMFRWYRESIACFAVLEDVSVPVVREVDSGDGDSKGGEGEVEIGEDFEDARWFTRGWTLQELLAPPAVHFFDRTWKHFGSKHSLVTRISKRTNIDEESILSGEWSHLSIARRMAWAAGRFTTRVEDKAYCLMGLFDVNMPMLYGEGERAFTRLQEEIIRDSDDESIFAWDARLKVGKSNIVGFLATSPDQFTTEQPIDCIPLSGSRPFSLTNRGIEMQMPVIERQENPGQKVGLLACGYANDLTSFIGVMLRPDPIDPRKYSRVKARPISVPVQLPEGLKRETVYLLKNDRLVSKKAGAPKYHVRGQWGGQLDYFKMKFLAGNPAGKWTLSKTNTLTMVQPEMDSQGGVSSVLVFAHPPTGRRFFAVLYFLPGEESAMVALAEAPDLQGDLLKALMEKLRAREPSMAKSSKDELVLGKDSLSARVSLSSVQGAPAFVVTLY